MTGTKLRSPPVALGTLQQMRRGSPAEPSELIRGEGQCMGAPRRAAAPPAARLGGQAAGRAHAGVSGIGTRGLE